MNNNEAPAGYRDQTDALAPLFPGHTGWCLFSALNAAEENFTGPATDAEVHDVAVLAMELGHCECE